MKRHLQRILRIRKTLKFECTTTAGQDYTHSSACNLFAGWYMIEFTPDAVTLGGHLRIECYSTSNSHDTSESVGKQHFPLGNTSIAKRLIRIHARTRRIHLCVDSENTIYSPLQLTLVRVSNAFAKSRMQRTLFATQKRVAHEVRDRSVIDTDEQYVEYSSENCPQSNDLVTLYSAYCGEKIERSLNSDYRDNSSSYVSGHYVCIDKLKNLAEYQSAFDVIAINDKNDIHLAKLSKAPLIVVASKDVRLQATFLQTLNKLSAALNRDGESNRIWYTDHDHIDDDGRHTNPCFKTGWNRGLLRQGNYVGAMIAISQKLYTELGGLDLSLGDSALLDLLLRAIGILDERSVCRIPQICYSLPLDRYHAPHGFFLGAKDQSVMQAYVLRNEFSGLSFETGRFNGLWHARHIISGSEPSVDILIPTRDRSDLLQQCIRSIESKTDYDNYTVTVIDNASVENATHDFHKRMLRNDWYRMLEFSGDFNYSAINNFAAHASNADHLILLNNDTEVLQSDWLQRMVAELEQEDVACVGTRLNYPNGLLQHAGVTIGMHGVAGHRNQFACSDELGYGGSIALDSDISAVTGACLGIRHALFQSLGGLNEEDLPVAFNDVDLCLRARNLGYRNVYLANVVLTHHESVSRGMDDDRKGKARFNAEVAYMKQAHENWIDNDPYWHPLFCRRSSSPKINSVFDPANAKGETNAA